MTEVALASTGAAGSVDLSPTAGAAPQRPGSSMIDDRYLLDRTLKIGNGVETFLAHDTATQRPVVVKAIASAAMHAAARLRLEHESVVLRRLSERGLPGLHDFGFSADGIYLVQPYIPGTPLSALLARGPLPVLTAMRIGVALAEALGTAHDAGICHRDVKPANVIVDGDDPRQTVTLVDFGFARSSLLDESIRDDLVGTVRYLAPEAAGLLAAPVDERSDLYALGVLLYECVTGSAPFPGTAVGDLLRQHLSMPVPELRAAGAPVPRSLDALVQRLLRKEPAERYQSAAAVAADLAALLAAMEAGDPDPALVIGRLDSRHSLTDPAFVGRESELTTLLELVQEGADGSGGLTLLEAESGGGKSRLLTEVAQRARRSGVAVLHGQGVAQGAQRPFTMLNGVADDLVALLGNDLAAADVLAAAVADVAPEVVRVLPALGPLLGVAAQPDSGPEQFGEQRSLSALRTLLRSVATAERPVLLVLDDCQWADTLTVRLLASLSEAGSTLGVIAAFRSEEVPAEHPLRAIASARVVRLGGLSPTAMSLLAESMAGPLPDEAVEAVARLADGSPFMGAAVLRGLVEGGALVRGQRSWEFDGTAVKDVQTARRSAPFLVRRIELLPDDALELLSIGAVLGKQFDVETAVRLSGQTSGAAAILEDARRRRLLWVDERTGRCSFFHDKIREALLDRLPGSHRRELHSRAADALPPPDEGGSVFELAYHLDAAGRGAEALPHALAAAELSRTRHALDAAVVHYRMAEQSVEDEDLPLRRRIAEGLGDVLTLQGIYGEAETQLARARLLLDHRPGAPGSGAGAAAALDGKLGDLAFKQGDIPTAKRQLEGAVALLGRPVPRSTVVLVLRLLWEIAVQAGHTLLPRLTTGRRSPAGRDSDFLAMRLYSRLAYLYWFHSGIIPCAWAHFRGLNLAERYPLSAELGQAYSEHAPVCTMLPAFSRGVRYASRSREIRERLGDVWGQGQSLSFTGVTLYAATRYESAAGACREAGRLLERTGDRWEVNTAGWNLAKCLHRQGDLRSAAETAQRVITAAQGIGDAASAGISLSVLAHATGGQVDAGLIAAELARGSADAHTACELHMAEGLRLLGAGQVDEAVSRLADGMALARRARLRQEYIAPVYAWYATALRRLVEATPAHSPGLRATRLRAARRAVRRARRWAFSYANNQPHALREAGLLASLAGRPRRAMRLLTRSIEVAGRQGARYEQALSRLARAEVSAANGSSGAEVDVARAMVQALEVPAPEVAAPHGAEPTLSVFDRFSTLLDVGRTITAAGSRAAVDAAVRESVLTLLRGERCQLVQLTRAGSSVAGGCLDEGSRTLVARAVRVGGPVVTSGSAADESESLLLSDLRCALAAPITVHGETVACFYVTSRHLGDLFGEQERQLAALIATLAGAAYEHLAGSEDRFRSLAQNSSDVLTLVDGDGLVSYQSDAVSRIFALPAASLVGKPVTDWVHPSDLSRFSDAMAEAAAGSGVRLECRFRHADGSYRFAETAITDMRNQPTVAALVLNTRDITERRRLEDELRERALHDDLTGLANRALFLDRARRALVRSRGAGGTAAIAFLDLDDFKAVNDTHGHAIGDELLCSIASRLTSCVRPADTVARLGGDEFALLLEDADLESATQVVERILTAAAAPVHLHSVDLVVGTSVGLVLAHGSDVTPDQLLAQADKAMYAAKALGKGRYSVYEPAMGTGCEQRSRLRLDLENALTREEFRLHYQPIMDLRTEARVGFEALIRWQHPDRGLLDPADFIEYAEQSPQIAGIGSWVLACATRASAHLGPAHMSVNVSARQIQHPSFVPSVTDALAGAGLAPSRLILEITETCGVSDTRGTVAKLEQLRGLGVQIALDDFGTGYSPLSYLRELPLDYLKVDRSFVRGMVTSPEDAAIVRGIVDLAHALGLRAVAEGVEETAQRDLLREMGCDLAQGYLWLRPCSLEDLVTATGLPRPRLATGVDQATVES